MERQKNLLRLLESREQTPEMIKRIERVKSQIGILPSVEPAHVDPPKKKKKTITMEIDE
jgi:hypothetical protein